MTNFTVAMATTRRQSFSAEYGGDGDDALTSTSRLDIFDGGEGNDAMIDFADGAPARIYGGTATTLERQRQSDAL